MIYGFSLKTYENGNYFVELETEITEAREVFIVSMWATYDGGNTYKAVRRSETATRRNALATYRRYVQKVSDTMPATAERGNS